MLLWHEVRRVVTVGYPGIWQDLLPGAYNLFGNLVTDLGPMPQARIEFASGGNMNREGMLPSMVEPVHD